MSLNAKDLTLTTVATAPSPATSGTSLTVSSGTGAWYPTTFPFYVTSWASTVNPNMSNAEILKVTAISTDTFTVVRAQLGTTAQSIAVGWNIGQGVYVEDLNNALSDYVPTSDLPLSVANGGTGITTTPANGALLIGNGTDYTSATLTAGTGITVTNASGSITIASSGSSSGGGGFEGTMMPGQAPNAIAIPEYLVAVTQFASNSNTYTKMQTFVKALNTTNPTIYLGVYNSSGTLLGSGSFTPTTANKFYSVTLSSSVTFTAGDQYWLAIVNGSSDSTTTFLEMPTGAGTAVQGYYNGATSMPSTLPTLSAFNEIIYMQLIS